MRISLIVVGKLKDKALLSLETEYRKRMGSFCGFEVVEVPAGAKGQSPAEIVKEESTRIIQKIKPAQYVVILDEKGKQRSSEGLAALFESLMVQGRSEFVFVIGGAFGLDDAVRKQSDIVLSLSEMTFPYKLCRLMITEQIYRAMSIINGLPYHKGEID